jgi:hypothetical protein
MDSQLPYGQLIPSMVTPDNLDQQQLLQNIQVFQPSFQLTDLQSAFAPYAALSQDRIGLVVAALQQNGLTPYLQLAIQRANGMAGVVDTAYGSSGSSGGLPVRHRRLLAHRPTLVRTVVQRPTLPPPSEGDGTYNCKTDDLALLAVGTAFLVIAVMSGGLVPGIVVITASFWAPLAAWGGAATGAWALGHGMFC